MKFEPWKDITSFNRTLMDDDYNDGQQFVLKDKRKFGSDAEASTTFKLGAEKNGQQSVSLEEKVKVSAHHFNAETKFKHDGSVSSEFKFGHTKDIHEMLKDTNAWVDLKGDKSGNVSNPNVGLEFMNEFWKAKMTVEAKKDGSMLFQGVHRVCSTASLGWNFTGPVRSPGNGSTAELAYASYFKDTGVQWATQWAGKLKNNKVDAHKFSFFFNAVNGANTAGSRFDYDHASKKWNSVVGLKMDQGDHTWKLRLHDQGDVRFALQWQLHKVAKATLNSGFNVKSVSAGSMSTLPWGLQIDLKY